LRSAPSASLTSVNGRRLAVLNAACDASPEMPTMVASSAPKSAAASRKAHACAVQPGVKLPGGVPGGGGGGSGAGRGQGGAEQVGGRSR